MAAAVTEGPLFKTVMAMVDAGDPNAEAHMMGELRRRMEDPSAWADAGTVLFRLGRWDESRTCLEQAVGRGERGADTLAALGFASYLTGAFGRSAECFLGLLHEDPGSGEAWRGLGSALAADGRYDEALKSFEEAVRFLPDDAAIGDRIWRLKFQFGDWDQAWRDFDTLVPADIEARWQALHGTRHRLWRGETLRGQDLVVFSHGGHGDAIQHFRWIEPLLAAGPARVTAIVRPALVALLSESPAMAAAGPERLHIIAEGAPVEDRAGYFTWWEGLARRFDARPAQAGAAVPYLAVPPTRRAVWRQRLGAEPGTRLIGLSWAGSPAMPEDRWRSIALAAFAPLFDVPGHRFVALQKGPLAEAEQAQLRAAGVIDLSAEIGDFTDTAAAVSVLDRVIAVDSAVAHLAGALGVETWLLNRASSEWRWGWKAETSFWYPTMRIFNQAAIGDWSPVIEAVAQALRA
jgi:tetratricopeptide (TPR) repeat protein